MFDALDELRNGDAGQNQSTDAQERMSSNLDEKYDTGGVHWALARNVMSLSEARLIWEAVDNITSRDYVYRKTAQGEYIIESEDALFFVRADAHEPYLDRIIRFSDGYWASIGFGKEEIANASNSDLEIREALSFLKEVYGEGFANEYQASDERTDGRKAGRGKRTSRGEVYRADGRGKNHAGNETGSESGTVKRYSVRDDTEGHELSDGQEDYFAESAIRDKNGALQVMYHATDNEFTVFSREYLGENTDAWSEEAQATAHIGFWFNTQNLSQNGKSLYTRAEEVYLNVTNPYDAGSLDGLVQAIAAVNEDGLEEPSEIGQKFRDWLEENGYDGVRLHDDEFSGTSVGALYPEQIKRTDKLSPTEDADIRYSVREGMSEEERYEALKDATIRVPAYDSENGVLTQQSVANLERMINRDARYYVSELFDKLGIGGTYENKAANIVFDFGSRGKNKSIYEQGARRNGFSDFAKMLTNFDAIVENAVPIEIHSDKYKGTRRENADLRQVSVFVSAFYDNGGIVPVQFEVKEYANRANELYVIVSLQKIRNAVFAAGRASAEDTFAATVRIPYEVSLQELFSKINPSDGDFLKYVPDGFLSDEQRSAKQAALMREERKIDGLRFSLRDTSTVDVETVLNENAQLREANEELRKQFQRTVGVQLDQKAIRKMARDLLKQYDSSYSIDTLTDNLSKVFDVVVNGGLTWDEASSAVVDMCRKVLEESSSFDTGLYEYDQPVRDYLKNVRLEISDDMRGGIELVADNGAAYRRGLFGIVGTARNTRLNGMRKTG